MYAGHSLNTTNLCLNVTLGNTIKNIGEIRKKREMHRPNAHLGVRYLEVMN